MVHYDEGIDDHDAVLIKVRKSEQKRNHFTTLSFTIYQNKKLIRQQFGM